MVLLITFSMLNVIFTYFMGYYIYVSSLVQYCWVADELWFAADQMDTENSAIGRASMGTHATSLPIQAG